MPVQSLPCPIEELNLEYTLMSGQAFRWRQDRENWWSCLLPVAQPVPRGPRHYLLRVWQDRQQIWYESFPDKGGAQIISDYFRLSVPLRTRTDGFAAADAPLAPAIAQFAGLRVMRQH